MKIPLLLSLGLLFLAGCGMSTVGMKCTVSGGEERVFMLGEGGPERATDGKVMIQVAMPGPKPDTKEIYYEFQAQKQKGCPDIKSIKVENVSDAEAELLLLDTEVKTNPAGIWRNASKYFDPKDERFVWVYHEGNTPRVFRFTITYADGKVSELYQLTIVPAFVKDFMRKVLGLAT